VRNQIDSTERAKSSHLVESISIITDSTVPPQSTHNYLNITLHHLLCAYCYQITREKRESSFRMSRTFCPSLPVTLGQK
jgi:hypothetical protein